MLEKPHTCKPRIGILGIICCPLINLTRRTWVCLYNEWLLSVLFENAEILEICDKSKMWKRPDEGRRRNTQETSNDIIAEDGMERFIFE